MFDDGTLFANFSGMLEKHSQEPRDPDCAYFRLYLALLISGGMPPFGGADGKRARVRADAKPRHHKNS
jgi:hypothetical protein